MLLLTLHTFSATGGIEKMSRVAGMALKDIAEETGSDFEVYSMYDSSDVCTKKYIAENDFRGFGGNKFLFVIKAVMRGIRSKTVVLSHINLSLPAYIIKLIRPRTKVIVMAHGIEVWKQLTGVKKKLLEKADQVVAVSNFTAKKLREQYTIKKITVINNCLDPFLPLPINGQRSAIRKEYGFEENDLVAMTLSRLAATEQKKNYDQILYSIKDLRKDLGPVKYLFVGKYDPKEKERLESLIGSLGLSGEVKFAGYVEDKDLNKYYGMADCYIMPSTKEGFGISFIEAMYYGLPVIGGNADGTTDALMNGKLGLMIDPTRRAELTAALAKVLLNAESFKPDPELVKQQFGFETYREKWARLIKEMFKKKPGS